MISRNPIDVDIYCGHILRMEIIWDPEKDALLKARYGFGFERVVVALGEASLLRRRAHPNDKRYPHQEQFVIVLDRYVWIVPFVPTANGAFLKTMFPSRKATRHFIGAKR